MRQKEFEDKAKNAAKEFANKKKVASQPETQFQKGALWAWELLTQGRTVADYEELLRSDLMDREGKVDAWKESLITETAVMMADRDGMQQNIMTEGRLLEKYDKNMNPYKESNPLYVHLKELQRSIGMQREHLGLSNKVNVSRIKESPKETVDETDPMLLYYKGKNK